MSRRTQRNVGVIGLGIIGTRVADNLRRRGFHAFVWNRTPRPYPNFVGSPSEVAELCDFVQIFVSDDDALMQMVQQMKRSLNAHHVILAHSTVAPHTMRAAAEVVQRRGAQFLDAPFTGSKGAAEKGELVYYVGGDDAAFRRARPVLEASSKEIIEIGEIGQATTIKVATNMVTAATVQAAAEALALVHSSGLSADKFALAMRGNASNSTALGMKLPKMLEGDFEPHFSVRNMLKDVQIAARMGRSHGLRFGATEAARDSLLEQAERGRANDDYSALSRVFFPERAPLQPVQAQPEAEEQATLAGLDEPAAPDEAAKNGEAAPTETRAELPESAGEEPSEAAPDDSVAEETDKAAAAESEREEPAREEAAAVEAKADSDASTSDAEDKPEAERVDEKEATLDLSLEEEPPAALSESESPGSGPIAEVESDGREPAAKDLAASTQETTAVSPASRNAQAPETVPALEPTATAAGVAEKEEQGARRGFFGRMFGRGGGDY